MIKRRKKPIIHIPKNKKIPVSKPQVRKWMIKRYFDVFDKIISNPQSPSYILNKSYRHFHLDDNIFITLCFKEEPDEKYNYFLGFSMIELSNLFCKTKSLKDKYYLFSDIQDYLLSLKNLSGLVNIVFSPDSERFMISVSDRDEYYKNTTLH